MNVPIWLNIGFHQQDRQDSKSLIKDRFFRQPVTSAQCIIGTDKYHDAGILLNYDDGEYSPGYAQFKKVSGALTKKDILQPFIFDDDFRFSKAGVVEIDYDIYVFDIGHQESFTAAPPIKVKCKFDGVVPNFINGHALVLTKKLFSRISDSRRHFHSMSA